MTTETGFVESANAGLYYEIAGQGPAMVFLHAGIADHRQWNHDFEAFAADFRVLRYDRRGFGKSEPAEGEYNHLSDLKTLLDHVGFDKSLILVGCSMGGRLAMDFALAYPACVRALVMVGSGPSGLMLDVEPHPKEAEAEKADEDDDMELLNELEIQVWVDGLGRSAEDVDPEVRKLALEMNGLALAHDDKQLGKLLPNGVAPAFDRLADLDTPVLVVVGEYDEPYSQAAADFMLANLPSAQKAVIPDAAHLANMDQPRLFEQVVRGFIAEDLHTS